MISLAMLFYLYLVNNSQLLLLICIVFFAWFTSCFFVLISVRFFLIPLYLIFFNLYFLASAAYQSLLGNTLIPSKIKKQVSESESEDEVERTLASTVQKSTVYVWNFKIFSCNILEYLQLLYFYVYHCFIRQNFYNFTFYRNQKARVFFSKCIIMLDIFIFYFV